MTPAVAVRNLANGLNMRAPGVSKSILEGLDEILTVNRLSLPQDLRRSLACTNIIENMNSVIRQACRNVERWLNTKMGLSWTAAGMLKAKRCFRRLKAYQHLPALKATLRNLRTGQHGTPAVDRLADAA
jgi:hypothetical protein